MPPLRLTSLLHAALPNASPRGRAVISALACLNGHSRPADELASWVGLRDRYQLNRVLHRDGLPTLERLAAWARVIYWIAEAEATGASLLMLAQREHVHPAAAYRLVRRITGSCWSQVRAAGLAAVLDQLRSARRRSVGAADADRARTAGAGPEHGALRAVRVLSSTLVRPRAPQSFEGVLSDRLAVADYPFDVAITSTGIALVTCGHAAALDILTSNPLARVGRIATGSAPTRVRVNTAGDRAYVTNQFSEDVAIIDVEARRQSAAIAVPGHPLGAALSPDERTLFVTTNTDRLHAIDLRSHRIVATVPVPMGIPQIAVHPAGHRVYVAGWRAGSVTECDASTLRTVRTFHLGGITQDLVVTSSGLLFVANQSGWIDVVVLASGRQISRVPTEGAAFGLAANAGESVLLVSLVFDGIVCVFDMPSLARRATLRPGGKPRLMAFAPAGGGALIANEHGWVDKVT